MNNKLVFETFIDPNEDVDIQDGGLAKIVIISDKEDAYENKEVFFRMHSWDETKKHEVFKSFEGKKVRLTLEVI